MNYLLAQNITKSFGERVLFENINLSIAEGQKIAFVARNGSGKTSLIKILLGQDIPDEGSVRIDNNISYGYLPQDPDLPGHQTISEFVTDDNNRFVDTIRRYESALDLFEKESTDDNLQLLQDLTDEMEALQAWDYEHKMKQILSKLGLIDFTQTVETLSGGQRKRLALAKVLIQNPDLIIMDEPTNHLDVEMIEWLESYLSAGRMALLLITHDRYFLDNVTNEILELDQSKLYRYQGNYQYYLEKKAEREAIQVSEIEKARNLYRKELDWIRRMPKARSTKAKYRVDSFQETEKKAHQKIETKKLELNVKMNRIGGKVLELKHLNKEYDGKIILKGFTHTFSKGEKIGVIGKNGVGKSTLLNIISGLEVPDSGKVNLGETTVFGYFRQESIYVEPSRRIIEVVKEIAEVIPLGNGEKVTASQFLTYFGFDPPVQFTPYEKLSGGEKRRLHLMMELIKNPNFLILDEPTNDLDLLTLNALEEFLENYQGCLVIVSHDRYFMDRLVDHLFVFEGEGIIKDFNGNYSDWRDMEDIKEKTLRDESKQSSQKSPAVEVIAPVIVPEQSIPKRKLSFNEKREYETLEKEIRILETTKEDLETKMASGQGSHSQFVEWSNEASKISQMLDEKSIRWLELSEGI